jgi:hypothetical protein
VDKQGARDGHGQAGLFADLADHGVTAALAGLDPAAR